MYVDTYIRWKSIKRQKNNTSNYEILDAQKRKSQPKYNILLNNKNMLNSYIFVTLTYREELEIGKNK